MGKVRKITERMVARNPWRYSRCLCGEWKLKRSSSCRSCFNKTRPAPVGHLGRTHAPRW